MVIIINQEFFLHIFLRTYSIGTGAPRVNYALTIQHIRYVLKRGMPTRVIRVLNEKMRVLRPFQEWRVSTPRYITDWTVVWRRWIGHDHRSLQPQSCIFLFGLCVIHWIFNHRQTMSVYIYDIAVRQNMSKMLTSSRVTHLYISI